jgi:sugar lactone lactonase YvrE
MVASVEIDWIASPTTELGEGPFWDRRSGHLGFVDIERGELLMCSTDGTLDYRVVVGAPISAAAPIEGQPEVWVAAIGHSVGLLDRSGRFLALCETDFQSDADVRLNDGKCDGQGRFWIGSMSISLQPGKGALYRVTGDGLCAKVVSGFTLCNGLGWSPDYSSMYLIDSVPGSLHAWDFDPEQGEISNQRILVEDLGPQYADGMAVDRDGTLWIAHCGAGLISRWSADGSFIDHFNTPTQYPTCPTFGGVDGQTLFVTSAAPSLSQVRDPSIAAGRVLVGHVAPGGEPNEQFVLEH